MDKIYCKDCKFVSLSSVTQCRHPEAQRHEDSPTKHYVFPMCSDNNNYPNKNNDCKLFEESLRLLDIIKKFLNRSR